MGVVDTESQELPVVAVMVENWPLTAPPSIICTVVDDGATATLSGPPRSTDPVAEMSGRVDDGAPCSCPVSTMFPLTIMVVPG